MRRKLVLLVILALIIVCILGVSFKVRKVEASGTIYIRADGSVEGTTDISTVDNVTYTFTGNIYDEIVIELDNIIVDGAGYTLQGTGTGKGIDLSNRNNTAIKNMKIRGFYTGIELYQSSNNDISGNYITNNERGIRHELSSNNTISGNTVTNNDWNGVDIWFSSNNTVSGNNITTNNGTGISLNLSFNSTISGNNITNNVAGIWLSDGSSNNTISGNNITNNKYGIRFYWSSYNTFHHNSFVDNTEQVYSYHSTNVWDDGYSSGGNYWSDYDGTDLLRGLYQNETGSDGIGDIPYVIDENNQDNYPLMSLEITPPTISILSPEQLKHYPENNVFLTFTVDEPTYWMGYSLNAQPNSTILGNTSLLSLVDGAYYVTVYANDTAGNMGASDTIWFYVDTTSPNITRVSQTPPRDNVLAGDEVRVEAEVTDDISGWQWLKVILNYTTNNGTWFTTPMTHGEEGYTATIPKFPYCTTVMYLIIAEDNATNTITSEQLEYDTQYHVIPEFPSFLLVPLFMIATLLAVIVYRRKQS